MSDAVNLNSVETIIRDKNQSDPENLLHILQEINSEFTYLPEEGLRLVANRLNLPLSQVYSVATYYHALNLEPRGRHIISVCTGTACHVRGAERIIEKLERDLDVSSGGTCEDKRFSLETVRCIGCCSLGPVITVDDDTHGRLKLDSISKIIDKYQ